MTRYFATHFGTYEVEKAPSGRCTLKPYRHDPAPAALGLHYLTLAEHDMRIAQPMVRRGWLAGDHGAKRGEDEFIAVEWDVAIAHVASELDRVRKTQGNEAIYAGSYGWASAGRFHHAQSQLKRLLNLLGGFTASRNSYSYGAASVLLPHVLGASYAGTNACAPSWDHIATRTDCLIAFGGFRLSNAQCDSGGLAEHSVADWVSQALARGMRLIVVSPDGSDAPPGPNVIHVPIRPNTDSALMLAMAHMLITRGTVDTEFVSRYVSGVEDFVAYVRGDDDHLPKSPRWAARITGVPEATIELLAEQLLLPTSLINMSWSLQRARFGEQPYWMAIALAALAGQIGKPGGGFAFGLGAMNSVGQPVRKLHAPGVKQGENPVETFIPVARLADMLARPGEYIDYDGQRLKLPDIRLIYWAGGNPFHHHQDLNHLRRVWKNPETVIVHEPVWTATAHHADIVLPTTLPFERNDIVASSNDRVIIANHQLCTPYAEARNDHDICLAIAEALGIAEAFHEGLSETEWLERLYAGYRSRYPELPEFKMFWAEGMATLDAGVKAPRSQVLLAKFIGDPLRFPLETPSGRIELRSEAIARFNYSTCPAQPAWLAPEEWLGAERAERYPLHLLTPQPANRLHSQLDVVGESAAHKINGREPVVLNRIDANTRGIGPGDTVRLYNDRGACLAGAVLSDTLLPGVVVLPTGAWYTPRDASDPMSLELGGNPNVLTSDIGSSQLAQGPAANSCLIEIERYSGS
ncbi:molybdopterin-dependent oxidoreductase [Phytohalomonas tamaricis]|uniref:molybdopterin-dependent oxidoreductase n=1 Tax=Phytohalomonas tamaricis TaxID=2081032 RepID=UPI000D0B0BFB|nr:molybdopterin-dependent oxidoreductase [Phytohalomonas tamaricis]